MRRKSIVNLQVQQNQSKSGVLIISKRYPDLEIGESCYLPCNNLEAARHLAQILDMSFSRYLDVDYQGSCDPYEPYEGEE
jgi:hypothetical protein